MEYIDIGGESNDYDLTIGSTFFPSSEPDIPPEILDEIADAPPAREAEISEEREGLEKSSGAQEIGEQNGGAPDTAQVIDETPDGLEDDHEIEDFMPDSYKIIGQLRAQDCYVIQKLRNGVIVPTWQTPGKPGRQLGSVLKISGDTAAEYTENLERAGDSCFPESSTNRALEVIY